MQKQKPVANMRELRYKMAEKFAALENKEISVGEAKAFVGIASVIVNSCKTEMVNNQIHGVTSAIDFLDYEVKGGVKGVGIGKEAFDYKK